MLGSVNQLAVTVGLLLAFVMGSLCKWRWLAFVGALPSALLLILMFSMPETPRWFLGRNRRSEALRALLWLRGPDVDIEEECAAIEATLGKSQSAIDVYDLHEVYGRDIFSRSYTLVSGSLELCISCQSLRKVRESYFEPGSALPCEKMRDAHRLARGSLQCRRLIGTS